MPNNSYAIRNRAAPLNHQVYSKMLYHLGLNDADRDSLRDRGLSFDQIKLAGYASKHIHKSNNVTNAIGKCATEFDLTGIPGFYIDDKTTQWDILHIDGIAIPVCDIEGNIHSVLFRNDKPKEKNGRWLNKYIAFSSAGKTKGGKVWQITHLPRLKGKAVDVCKDEVRVTEGVLKSDVATALDDIYTIGIQGLKVHEDLPTVFEELQIARVVISLDQGEDDNVDMMRCKAELIEVIRKCGHEVAVEWWDAKYGKGIDDVLKNGHKDKIKRWTEAEIEQFLEKANRKNPNNGEWLYIVDDKSFINKKFNYDLDKSQFADVFGLVKTENVNLMLAAGFPQVGRKTFLPQGDKIVVEDGQECYNMWYDPMIQPIAGNVEPMLEHFRHLIPDETERNHVLDFLAYQIQKPGKKITYALLLQGVDGTGKSFVGEMMSYLVGEPNVCRPSNEQLHERFSHYQKQTQLIIIEEIMSQGRLELMNKMKPMITQGTAQVREMHKNEYQVKNRYNIIAFTNHPDAIIIDKNDRRWLIIFCNKVLRTSEEYSKLWTWLKDKSNIPAIAHYFISRDLSKFNPDAHAPDTAGRQEVIRATMHPLEEWITNCKEECVWPFNLDLITIRDLKNQKVCPSGFERLSDNKWATAIKNAGGVAFGQVKMSDGSMKKVWMIRRHEMYKDATPEFIKQQYEKSLSDKEPGGNPLLDMKPL